MTRRLDLSGAMAVLVASAALARVTPGCSSDEAEPLRCGPGTVRIGEECVPADASVGGGGGSGGGTMDASAGSGGSAGTVSDAGDGGTVLVSCPTTLAGPTMILIKPTNAGPFCIDSTEVTHAQYAAFLAAPVKPTSPAAACASNVEFDPLKQIDGAGQCPWGNPTNGAWKIQPDWPVSCVDWCDAWSFCNWAGKKLCGALDGGSNAFGAGDDPKKSQWFHACSNGGAHTFPYGDVYEPKSCRGQDAIAANEPVIPAPVNSHPACEGGVVGIFDMSGNVSEWTDECEGDVCRTRGGAYATFDDQLGCSDNAGGSYSYPRAKSRVWTGFRCCL